MADLTDDTAVYPIDYTVVYEVADDLYYICYLTEALLFRQKNLRVSGYDEEQTFNEIKRVLFDNITVNHISQFWLLNNGCYSIENLYMTTHDTVIRETFIKEVNSRLNGLSPILEQLVSEKNWKINITKTLYDLSKEQVGQRGKADIGCEVCQAIEEAATLLQTMDRLSSSEKQKAPTESTLEGWFLEDPEKWIRFIGEQLRPYQKPQGKFIALLLHLLEEDKKMNPAYENNFSKLHQLLVQRYPHKIGERESIRKYLKDLSITPKITLEEKYESEYQYVRDIIRSY